MQWYYAQNGARVGPVTQEQFDRLSQSGAITAATLVWRAGMPAWLPLAQALAQTAPGADSAICAVSGRVFPKRDMLEYNGQWISAEHKDEFFQRLREGVPQQGEMRYVGFWFRFLAYIIDYALLWVVGQPVGYLIGLALGGAIRAAGRTSSNTPALLGVYLAALLAGLLIGLAYNVFLIRKFDATLGKMAIGAKIVRSDGGKLSVGRIIGRYFARMVSGFCLCIGYMMAGWNNQKCALHDYMCDTRVVKK